MVIKTIKIFDNNDNNNSNDILYIFDYLYIYIYIYIFIYRQTYKDTHIHIGARCIYFMPGIRSRGKQSVESQ